MLCQPAGSAAGARTISNFGDRGPGRLRRDKIPEIGCFRVKNGPPRHGYLCARVLNMNVISGKFCCVVFVDRLNSSPVDKKCINGLLSGF